MKKFVKNVIYQVLFWTGISPFFFYHRYRKKENVLIMLYHRIRSTEDPFEPAVTPENFDKHLRFMKKYFHFCTTEQMLQFMKGEYQSDKPLAMVSFDDGFADNYEVAYPILEKHQIPTLFFVATGSVGNEMPMWTSRVEALFKSTKRDRLEMGTFDDKVDYLLGEFEQRMDVCYQVKSKMKKVTDAEREIMLLELQEKLGDCVPSDNEIYKEMMSWSQVRQLDQKPYAEIGSHTVKHRMLTNVPSEEVREELVSSKNILEKALGHPVPFLSYPGNNYNEETCEIAEQSGFRAAFAVDQDAVSKTSSPYAIPRMHVENGGIPDLVAEMSFVMPCIRKVLGGWRK